MICKTLEANPKKQLPNISFNLDEDIASIEPRLASNKNNAFLQFQRLHNQTADSNFQMSNHLSSGLANAG